MLKLPLPLLLLVAVPGRATPATSTAPVECGAELRNVELEVGASEVVVCVAREATTTLRFDTPILVDRTVLEGGEVSVTSQPTTIYLEATRALPVGARRRLTVYFADGREPSSATFVLLGQRAGKPRQVNLFRRARTAASLRLEAEQQRQRAEVCEQQLAQCHEAAPAGLLGRVLKLGGRHGIHLQWHRVKPPTNQAGEIAALDCFTTRVKLEDGRREAAVELRLSHKGTEDWTVEGASLLSAEGQPLAEVQVLSDTALPAADTRELHVVVGPTPRELRGTYTLKLRGGGRELSVEGIIFP